MTYTVVVADNFHYRDEDEHRVAGKYKTAEKAVRAARKIVDRHLKHAHKRGMSADELFRNYTMFGEGPFILGGDQPCGFSAWDYARERCAVICRKKSDKL